MAVPPTPQSPSVPGSPWLPSLGGRFIVFDGPDGSGKSTQVRRFVEHAKASGVELLQVREPGGTALGERVRALLLDPSNGELDVRAELLLYMASRAQLVAQRIRPALAQGRLVLADRFISSTLAYQGTAGGVPYEDIHRMGEIVLGDCWPDLTVVFDVDEATAAARMNPLLRGREFGGDLDRMEMKGVAYHRRVREGFLRQVREDPARHLLLDARGSEAEVWGLLIDGLAAWAGTLQA